MSGAQRHATAAEVWAAFKAFLKSQGRSSILLVECQSAFWKSANVARKGA
ncbi:hypothetical protein MMIC_P0875 [Mariprofundus micogutta]|uniref:Uncharacterized protein n=1 Tax=Mariprofundus micogutta TaxID=1921010 RepID=A0A1L8CLY8_9PROT|nr:hypothetical protein [Mariprofundus micogutta]GAV19916.1 hypothetical protein MMIC_P0875 [Mariprofundus micogutta]